MNKKFTPYYVAEVKNEKPDYHLPRTPGHLIGFKNLEDAKDFVKNYAWYEISIYHYVDTIKSNDGA
jgi:hypothetical protein